MVVKKRYTTCRHCGVVDVQDIRYRYKRLGRVQRSHRKEIAQDIGLAFLALLVLYIWMWV